MDETQLRNLQTHQLEVKLKLCKMKAERTEPRPRHQRRMHRATRESDTAN